VVVEVVAGVVSAGAVLAGESVTTGSDGTPGALDAGGDTDVGGEALSVPHDAATRPAPSANAVQRRFAVMG
jgi:hypothetical protein